MLSVNLIFATPAIAVVMVFHLVAGGVVAGAALCYDAPSLR
jgi:hypothetical protein